MIINKRMYFKINQFNKTSPKIYILWFVSDMKKFQLLYINAGRTVIDRGQDY
jgi:hypothetical protein